MARPRKRGISFFPVDCDIFQDGKILLLMQRCGGDKAVGFLLRLLCRIYGLNGYYIDCGRKALCLLAQEDGQRASAVYVDEVIRTLVEVGFFDREMYEKHQILTSRPIQRRYLYAVRSRVAETPPERPFWLLGGGALPEPEANEAKTGVSTLEMPQTKRNETITYIPSISPSQKDGGCEIGEGELLSTPAEGGGSGDEHPPVPRHPPCNPRKKSSRARSVDDYNLDFIVDIQWREAYKCWLTYKAELGHYYVLTSLCAQYNKLCNLSGNDIVLAEKIITQSITEGWRGLQPLHQTLKRSPNATTRTSTNSRTFIPTDKDSYLDKM